MFKKSLKDRLIAYLFALPAVLLFVIMIAVPMIMGVTYSFTDWSGITNKINFVGLRNYMLLFQDKTFYVAIKNTFFITIVTVIMQNVCGVLLAVAMNSKRIKAKGLLKVIYFIPNLLSVVVVCYTWMYLLNVHVGLFGWILGKAGVTSVVQYDLLIQKIPALTIIAIILVWQFSGYNMTIYLSGLQAIDSALYESAECDGASGVTMFFNITLPLLMPSITICFFVNMIGCLKIFEQVYILTKGGPGTTTTTIGTFIYNSALSANQYGYATAISTILFLIVLVVTLIQVKITRAKEVEM